VVRIRFLSNERIFAPEDFRIQFLSGERILAPVGFRIRFLSRERIFAPEGLGSGSFQARGSLSPKTVK
jgi:hypothetical protein